MMRAHGPLPAAAADEVAEAVPAPADNVHGVSVTEARELIATRSVGRLAYLEDTGGIAVAPVNYVVDGTTVVFRTASPAILERARRRATVSFHVDDIDEAARTGWSVLVRGRLAEVTEAGHDALPALPDTWPSTPDLCFVRVEAHQITARRVTPHAGEGALWIG